LVVFPNVTSAANAVSEKDKVKARENISRIKIFENIFLITFIN